MPNYCFNTLTICGTNVEITRFLEENVGEHSLCLAKSLPFPNDLSPGRKRSWKDTHWGTTRDIDSKYNTNTWVSQEKYEFTFESAWSPPDAWLKNIAKMYPTLQFSLFYEEPNSHFRGSLIVENTKILQETYDSDYEDSDSGWDADSIPDSVS